MLGFLSFTSYILFSLCFLVATGLKGTGKDSAPEICKPLSLTQVFLHTPPDDLLVEELFSSMSLASRVFEPNESTALEQTLNQLWSKEEVASVMLLLYASWCPFSQLMRPLFDNLSSVYPSVYHIAIEESGVRPSVLSKFAVSSYPALIHLTPASKTRYQDAKTLTSLVKFYRNMTGLAPNTEGSSEASRVHLKKLGSPPEVCPYPQAISPEKLLHDDMYLRLATGFLVLRLASYFLPTAIKSLRWWWGSFLASVHHRCN